MRKLAAAGQQADGASGHLRPIERPNGSPSAVKAQTPRFCDLAEQIEHEHQAAVGAARSAIEHAIECGRLLLKAKTTAGHGNWLEWVRANLSFGPRQAQKYCRLAEHADALPDANLDAHLTIDRALALLATPKSEHPALAGACAIEEELELIRSKLPALDACLDASHTAEQAAAVYVAADEFAHRAMELTNRAGAEASHLWRQLAGRLGGNFVDQLMAAPDIEREPLIEARIAELRGGQAS
jgi:Protein of unknown function (DUF3102)